MLSIIYIFRQLLIFFFQAGEKEKKINKDDIYKNLYTHGIYIFVYLQRTISPIAFLLTGELHFEIYRM